MNTRNSAMLLFLFISFFPVCGQDIIRPEQQIRFSPLRILDPVNPGIEFNYQHAHGEFFATQFLASWQKDVFNITFYNRYSGYRLGIEEKYFLPQRGSHRSIPKSENYVSAEFIYSDLKMMDEAWFGDERPNDSLEFSYNYKDLYGIKKKTYSGCIKIGMEQRSKHLVCDVAFGLGIRVKNVHHFDRLVPGDDMEVPLHGNAYYLATSEGRSVTPLMTFSFKLGYIF